MFRKLPMSQVLKEHITSVSNIVSNFPSLKPLWASTPAPGSHTRWLPSSWQLSPDCSCFADGGAAAAWHYGPLCAKWCANKLWSQFLVACELNEYWSELTQKSRQTYPHSSGPIHRGLSSPLWTKSSFCRLCKSALADDILSVIFDRKLKWSYDMVREHYSLPVPALSHFTSNSHLPHTCMQTCAFHKCLCVIDDTNLSQP